MSRMLKHLDVNSKQFCNNNSFSRIKKYSLRVIPINGVFWGAMLLSEPVTGSMIAALVLILSGVILVNRVAAKKAEKVVAASEQ